jgi:signal recognition particle subunit SRP54
MLEKLSSALKKATDKVANAIFLDKELVDGIVKDLQRALIEADVNVSLVMQISQKIKKEALDERIKGVEKKEHLIKILHDELLQILGKKRELVLGKKNTFMMVGLYGAGKTTTIGKLAGYYSKRGWKVCTVGLDVHRPAAPEQLKQICDKIKIPCFVDLEEKDPKKIWKKFEDELKDYNLVIVDTAGRDALDSDLISEIESITKLIKPTESFLVIQADIGQTAKKQAQVFKEAAKVTGVIITKMDSTAKAGGALTACAEVNAPVAFIGTGERVSDLETFDPESFLSRLLGMGDLKSLMEKIHSVMDEKEIEKQQKKLEAGKFTLRDLQTQLESMSQLGSMDKLLGMIPGMGKVKDKISSKDMEEQESKMKKWKNAINSMTQEEIENPEILEKQTSRMQRIAHGSGTTTSDIRLLLKQWKMLNEMIKSQSQMAEGKLDQKTIMKMARKFGGKMKF